jgi:hypothetical protein
LYIPNHLDYFVPVFKTKQIYTKMQSNQMENKKLGAEDKKLIASNFSCSEDYVKKISEGTRKANSRKSRAILKAIELVSTNKLELKKSIAQIDLDGE